MNWDAIGAVGETLGSMAVLATLVYVAAQLKQNSQLAKAQLEHSIMQGFGETRQFMLTHPEVFAKLRAGIALNEVETVIRDTWLNAYLYACATAFHGSRMVDPVRADRFVSSAAFRAGTVASTLDQDLENSMRASGYADFVTKVKLEMQRRE
jgi:hypothetical protein